MACISPDLQVSNISVLVLNNFFPLRVSHTHKSDKNIESSLEGVIISYMVTCLYLDMCSD